MRTRAAAVSLVDGVAIGMMPQLLSVPRAPWIALLSAITFTTLVGCTSTLFHAPSSKSGIDLEEFEPDEVQTVRLVRDFVMPWGTNYVALEGVALVTGLGGNGSDPAPSGQRSNLLNEMQTHDVRNPNAVLASADTSLVIVRTILPPGVQKGDRLDVEVRVPARSETRSLEGGWLMKTRLREVAVLNDSLRTGRVSALAEGPVTIDSVFSDNDDKVREVRGKVLGGAVSTTSRPLGLVVRSENHSIRTASLIGAAINARFFSHDRGIKRGVATPKRDNYIELEVHPRYKHNLARYMRVIRALAVNESAAERVERLELLEQQLLEPATSASAALQLEAIGREGIRLLHLGARSEDPEVRFYAAEALGYLDDAAAAEPLGEIARNEPSFRWHAIAALSAMDHISAHDELSKLLHVSSAETRYAAFVALRTRNSVDPLISGERLGDAFQLHVVNSTGPPMIHLSRSRHAEIVLFGPPLELDSPDFIYAGKQIMLKADGADRIRVMRFAAREEDREVSCPPLVDEAIRRIVELDGTYSDVAQFLQEARNKNYVDARLVVDALPSWGREFRRSSSKDEAAQDKPDRPVASPIPGLFEFNPSASKRSLDSEDEPLFDVEPADEEPDERWWGRLGDWFTGG
jgi:flagellar basal body P-ring protein FlgI